MYLSLVSRSFLLDEIIIPVPTALAVMAAALLVFMLVKFLLSVLRGR